MKSKPWVIGGALLAVLAILALMTIALNRSAQEGRRPSIGSAMPDFALTLYDVANGGLGQRLDTKELRGKVLVVNFWGSWCAECHDEAEALQSVSSTLARQGVIFIGVGYLDTETKARDYLTQYAITYANGADEQQRISRMFRITGAPETFIVDKDGIVRDIIIGPIDAPRLTQKIQAVIQ
jgi:cytochrome c biogenesis protein CcmG/thiol:disulfide interchange protein DsbE